MTFETYLHNIYYDPSHAGSLAGVDKLYRAVRKEGKYVLSKAKIKKWLESQETFGLHRQINRASRRRRVIAPFIDYQWEGDTCWMASFAKDNDDYRYFLLVIDVFSRYVWTVPLKSTKGTEMYTALKSIFDQGRSPHKLRTDKGVEFRNRHVAGLLKEKGIDHFFSQNEQKSSVSERGIKSLKGKISRYMSQHQTHRWIDILQSITHSYNSTYHRSIKMAPRSVTKRDESRLWKLQYPPQEIRNPSPSFKFNLGDTVRISHIRRPFDREYDERWTMEYFVVESKDIKEGIPVYTVKDTFGDEVKGTFHESELNKVRVNEHTTYRIDKIIKRRGDQVLVQWLGWPKKFNSWIARGSLKAYKRT